MKKVQYLSGLHHKWYCVSDYTKIEPKAPGCYAIYIFDVEQISQELVYIGTANNLRSRLEHHPIKQLLYDLLEYPNVVYVKCKVMPDEDKRKNIESYLIKRLRPKYNKSGKVQEVSK